jgi:protein SCO1
MYCLGNQASIKSAGALIALAMLTAVVYVAGCQKQVQDEGERAGFAVRNASDCLPDITLLDQHGQKVSLASLKGKPVVFDFIYTTCPGPCLMLTARMKQIANQLGSTLGPEVRLVSITVDPEHDQPPQLLAYANDQGANENGWLFLTGTPKQIDDVMAHFDLIRRHEADGTVDHVLEFFLVGADGHALLQYMGEKADPKIVAGDLEQAAEGKPVTAGDGTVVPARS